MMKRTLSLAALFTLVGHQQACVAQEASPTGVEPWRVELYENWKKLPEPPVTPYHGPFGPEARAFTVSVRDYLAAHGNDLTPEQRANFQAINDWHRTAPHGIYDPKLDPRPINTAFEAANLDDWRRMGYNTAYKGSAFTFMVGSTLKERGMLGAIDQTLWGNGGPPPLQFDGKEGSRQREACGSFFEAGNYQAGVDAIFGMGHHYGHHLFTVGDHKLTCSWDEVGLRTRAQMDYREPMREEFRKFLRDVWFQDASPAEDSNRDGRTYNRFTGENLSSWDEVEPVQVSLDWTQPGWDQVKKDGTRTFSAMPEHDTVMFREPARYKLLVDFHRYYTFEFFRRINEDATTRMNEAGTPGRVSCYPFAQHFIIWPGANQRHGNSFYWYHRLSPVVNVEHMWPESPVMNLNYAVSDRLAPRHRNPIMGWVWFYFGQEGFDMYSGPHDISRAMARMMGRRVDGIHHWLYSPRYRGRDRSQRLQLAYWQNFFKAHYAGFLAQSEPVRPQIALLMPDTTGYFYRYFQYPKQDFGWTADAFQHLQYPYDLLTEEELELGETDLNDYKALYVVGSEWSTPAIREQIAAFIKNGGTVFANVDSLSLCVSANDRTAFLREQFGVDIVHKHKNGFFPSTQSAEEALWAVPLDTWGGPLKLQGHRVHDVDDPRAWARLYARTEQKYLLDADGKPQRPIPPNIQGQQGGDPVRDPSWQMIRDEDGNLVRDDAVWAQVDAMMDAMPREVRGIAQSPLDMRNPPMIRYAGELTAVGEAVTWSEVVEATPVDEAKPIAWWGDKVVGIETERTVWLGTREGMSIHALFPRIAMHRATEPCNPYPAEIPELYEAFRPYSEAIGYAARKAGVTRPVSFTREGELPMNLEVLPRVAADGTLMVIAISHDKTEAVYDVAVDASLMAGLEGVAAWDVLNNRMIEEDTDGRFAFAVPSWGVAVFMIGQPEVLAPIRSAQAKLMAMDMSVPQYFIDRPNLNEYEHGSPVPPIGE